MSRVPISTARLVACDVQPTQARLFAPILDGAMTRFGIDTHRRQAAFLAQAIHESQAFQRLEENLFYSSAQRIRDVWPTRFRSVDEAVGFSRNPHGLANRVYANRLGNGDESSGDGWRFRGRGVIQLTGRANYRMAGLALKMPYEQQPELVGKPVDAVLTACWFWVSNRCNELADLGDHSGMCRAINGPALAGLQARTHLYRVCFEALA